MPFMMRRALITVVVAVLPAAAPTLAEACPNPAFRTGPAANLPDCRAYEMVSPVDKGGFEVATNSAVDSIASGGSVVYASPGAFEGAPSGALPSQYMATRKPGLWLTTPLSPPSGPAAFAFTPVVLGVSADFTKTAVTTNAALTEDATAGDTNLYLHDLTTGAYRLVAAGPPTDESQFTPHLKGSGDLSHVVFAENAGLASTPAPLSPNLNLYDWSSGHLGLAGILPDGTVAATGSDAAHPGEGPVYNDVSEDGSRIYFSTLSIGPIYLRENGSVTKAITISQRGPSPSPEPQNGKFWYGTPDGSKAYFVSAAQLTNETSVNPGGPFWRDLYQYNATTEKLRDITPDSNISDPEGASVEGVLGTGGTGPDGTYVYFTARGVLAQGATSGQVNLYVWHDSANDATTKYIATLNANEYTVPEFYTQSVGRASSNDTRISPNGRFLAFTSTAGLTGDNNAGYREIFLYDSVTNSLHCASCDPTGTKPVGEAFFEEILRSAQLEYLRNRALLDNGLLFFNTPDALVPQDDNNHIDVYEYENGAHHLISSGHGNADSLFADAGADGTDVFFITKDHLVGQDADSGYDLYDARVDGGLTGQNPAPPAPLCQGDACRPPASAPPAGESVGSVSFEGLGNLAAPPIKPNLPALSPRLASALRVCRAKHNRRRRHACEAKARKRYERASTQSTRRAK